MEKTVKYKLWNLTVTMTAENVGGGEDRYQEWLNIRKEIGKLCKSLESVDSHEKWTRIVTEINQIRKRVEDLKVANWLWSVIKKDLDGCVEMINEHERGDSVSVADVRHDVDNLPGIRLESLKSYIQKIPHAKLPDSYRAHIVSEIDGVLTQLENFQNYHSSTRKSPTPNSVIDMPTEPKLRVKLYIVGGNNWAMPPITQDQRVGLELCHVVPFYNWNGLHCSIDHGNDEGAWRDMYMDSRERYSGKTEPQIIKEVMEKLDTVQTEAFEVLRDDPTTILSLYLSTKGFFEMPKAIQPWTGVGSAMPGNVDSLLTSLKTYM
jgi:hypothetical protein